jgi:hypothetical protein
MLADTPRNILDLQTQILAQTGRVGSARFVESVDISGGVGPATDSVAAPIIFPGSGWVIAMYGQTLSTVPTCDALDFATLAFRLQFGGTEDMTVDGRGAPDFLPMLAAVGGVSNWMPMLRRVNRGDLWMVTFRNSGAVRTQNPKLVFAFVTDQDLARMQAAR